MIHPAFDPDRNWQTRLDAEAADRAMRADSSRRKFEDRSLWGNAIGCVAMALVFLIGLHEAYRAGLFAWLMN